MAKVSLKDLISVVGGTDATGIPEWKRTSLYDKKYKTIYIPALDKDVERAGKYKKMGKAIKFRGHTFLPLEILKKLHPDDDFSPIEEGILESIRDNA